MKNENGQRVVLNVMWKGLDGKGGGEVDVDFTDKTVFDVKAAGDLRMSAKILPLPKTDYEKMQLDRLKLIDAARNGLLPTFPVEVDSQSVFIHNRIVRLTDGLVAPHESLTLGVFACVPVLIAGFEVAKECAESFDLDNLTAGRMQLTGSRVPASTYARGYKDGPPVEPIEVGGGIPLIAVVTNKSSKPARFQGTFICVDLTLRQQELDALGKT